MAAQNSVPSRGALLRLRAMESQLVAALNFCSTAENALVLGQDQHGRKAIEQARHTAREVRAHLDEPNHVPAESVAGIRDKLAALERRVSNLEARFSAN